MKLIEFNYNKKRTIWVNPEKVVTVYKYSDSKTIITFVDGQSNEVLDHDVDYVVRKLTESEL